jgi:hypothetical protein
MRVFHERQSKLSLTGDEQKVDLNHNSHEPISGHGFPFSRTQASPEQWILLRHLNGIDFVRSNIGT